MIGINPLDQKPIVYNVFTLIALYITLLAIIYTFYEHGMLLCKAITIIIDFV